MLAALGAFASPLDLLIRYAGRASPTQLRHHRVRELIIAIDVLHIVMVVQHVNQLDQLLGRLVRHRDAVLGPPDDGGG